MYVKPNRSRTPYAIFWIMVGIAALLFLFVSTTFAQFPSNIQLTIPARFSTQAEEQKLTDLSSGNSYKVEYYSMNPTAPFDLLQTNQQAKRFAVLVGDVTAGTMNYGSAQVFSGSAVLALGASSCNPISSSHPGLIGIKVLSLDTTNPGPFNAIAICQSTTLKRKVYALACDLSNWQGFQNCQLVAS